MQVASVRVMNYDLFTKKDCNAKIAMIPDFHDASFKRVEKVFEKIEEISPDAVVIQGDVMQARKYAKDSESQKRLKGVLKNASEICDIFLGLGNHDLYGMDKELMEGYIDLGKDNPGVHPLNNESYLLDKLNIRFTEFHTSHISYAPSRQDSGNALLLLSDEIDTLRNLEVSSDDKYVNLLMYHNPKIMALAISIATQIELSIRKKKLDELAEISKILSKFDGILSSHLHSGYLSITSLVNYVLENPEKALDFGFWEMPQKRNIDGNISLLFNPLVFEKTNMCRGAQYISSDETEDSRIIEMPREDESKEPKYIKAYGVLTHNKEYYESMDKETALKEISSSDRTPIYIAGAVNPLFNLPIGVPEITVLNIYGKVKKRQ